MKAPFIVFFSVTSFLSNTVFAQSKNQLSDRKITESHVIINDTRKNQVRLISYHYDQKGNIIESVETTQDSSIVKWERTSYNRNENEILHEFLNADGKVFKRIAYEYNNFEQLTQIKQTDADNQIVEIQRLEYDKFGNKIKEDIFEGNSILRSSTIYTYDNKDMLIGKVIYDSNGKIIYSKYTTYTYPP